MGDLKTHHPAKWWLTDQDGKIKCTLCPRYCRLGQGQAGFCYIRKNVNGELISLGYGRPTGFGIDPIEKKPLNHFLPGSTILSFGTAGCNLGCKFCQNWSMSKAKADELSAQYASPQQVVDLANRYRTPSIAFTYNDPTIFAEYVIDISRLAREQNINSVMVTNGYIDKDARKEVYEFIDAANVDLKAFSERFYHKLTASHLEDVLETLLWLHNETSVWLEITTLLIPDENDDPEEIRSMCRWIVKELSPSVPLHFTAFHPDYKMSDRARTPAETLKLAREVAFEEGLHYCYVGNIHDHSGQNTICHKCKSTVIERDWHSIVNNRIDAGCCPDCGTELAGRW